jgi:hypothetical protein
MPCAAIAVEVVAEQEQHLGRRARTASNLALRLSPSPRPQEGDTNSRFVGRSDSGHEHDKAERHPSHAVHRGLHEAGSFRGLTTPRRLSRSSSGRSSL